MVLDMIEIRLKEQNTISGTAMAQLKVKKTRLQAQCGGTFGRLRQEDWEFEAIDRPGFKRKKKKNQEAQ